MAKGPRARIHPDGDGRDRGDDGLRDSAGRRWR